MIHGASNMRGVLVGISWRTQEGCRWLGPCSQNKPKNVCG